MTPTRVGARTLAVDPATKKVYTVTADGAVDAAKPLNSSFPFYPNTFFDHSFTVLTYSRK